MIRKSVKDWLKRGKSKSRDLRGKLVRNVKRKDSWLKRSKNAINWKWRGS
jgi:hypothetical protein